MDIYDETKEELASIWSDELKRQNAKIVISTAISQASDTITAQTVQNVLDVLDVMLLPERDETKRQNTPSL